MTAAEKSGYVRCRCCGEQRRPGARSTTTCQWCLDECTREGCVGRYFVPVESEVAHFLCAACRCSYGAAESAAMCCDAADSASREVGS